jgi:hypothetical protein
MDGIEWFVVNHPAFVVIAAVVGLGFLILIGLGDMRRFEAFGWILAIAGGFWLLLPAEKNTVAAVSHGLGLFCIGFAVSGFARTLSKQP